MAPLRPRPEDARPGRADPGELFGDSPQAAREIRVLRGGGAADKFRCAAHVRKVAGSGEAVAGNAGDGGVQGIAALVTSGRALPGQADALITDAVALFTHGER